MQAEGGGAGGDARHRISSLDSLRGIAAIAVVLGHVLQNASYFVRIGAQPWAIPGGASGLPAIVQVLAAWTPLRLLWGAQEAVVLFFVLSGYVLALPYLESSSPSYGAYLRRRICRLYIPYAAAVILAAIIREIVLAQSINLSGLDIMWKEKLGPYAVLEHMFFFGGADLLRIDPPIWSLVHEMRISIVYPMLLAAVLWLPGWLTVTIAAAVALLSTKLPGLSPILEPGDVIVSPNVTLSYFYLFILGILAARNRIVTADWLGKLGGVPRLFLLVAAFWLLAARTTFGPGLASHIAIVGLIDGFGATAIVMLAASPGCLRDFLEAPSLVWLGKISYSLYLTHIILIYTFVAFLGPGWGTALALAAAIPVAWLFHLLVEAPAIVLGRRLGAPR